MSSNTTFHGDGISIPLFHYFWRKSKKSKLKINIPDTVIYLFGHASVWYFTSTSNGDENGTVLRKRKQNVTNELIYERFSKNRRHGGIVAYFISSEQKINDDSGIESVATSIQYFDKDSLYEFLFDSRKECSGILQRFIVSRGTENSIIRSVWSPSVCLLERRTNNNQLQDKRHIPDIYERVVTFEGPEMHSCSTPLRGTALTGKIRETCENMVQHIINISEDYIHLKRLVGMFKVDERNKVWFLWSTSIRLEDAAKEVCFDQQAHIQLIDPLDIEPRYDLRNTVKLCPVASFNTKSCNPVSGNICISCNKDLSTFDDLHPVPYKTIITHFERVIELVKHDAKSKHYIKWPPDDHFIKAGGNIGFGTLDKTSNGLSSQAEPIDLVIPPIIRKLHSRLKLSGYYRYRNDPLFLHRTCSVCDSCFLSYANLVTSEFYVVAPVLVDENLAKEIRFKSKSKNEKEERGMRCKQIKCKWEPVQSDFETKPSTNHGPQLKMYKRNLSFSDPPIFPDAITAESVEDIITDTRSALDEKILHLTTTDSYATPSLKMSDVMKQKEEEYFLEIANETTTERKKKQNPLHHIIEAHKKLIRKRTKKKSKENPYGVPLKIVEKYEKGRKDKKIGHNMPLSSLDSKHKDFIEEAIKELENHLC